MEGDDSSVSIQSLKPSGEKKNSKNKMKDGLKKVHSESQRMVRESSVCLPYHKPKQKSLMDFLGRKRVGSLVNDDLILKPNTNDDMVVQLLEERAQEIEEFFKSESEDDENLSCSSPISELFEGSKKISSTEELLSNDEVSSSNNVPSQQEPNTSHFSINESLSDNDKSSSSNYPIKEDILSECNAKDFCLPLVGNQQGNEARFPGSLVPTSEKESEKLSVETLHLHKSPRTIPSKETFKPVLDDSLGYTIEDEVQNVKKISIAKLEKPRLNGKPGQMLDLDLESGDTTDQKEKVNKLIERFVKQVSCTKKSPRKKDVDISIVEKVVNEKGEFELKRNIVSVNITSRTNDDVFSSVGRRKLLKESLRKSISAKRIVERKKRCGTDDEIISKGSSFGTLDCKTSDEEWSDSTDSEGNDDRKWLSTENEDHISEFQNEGEICSDDDEESLSYSHQNRNNQVEENAAVANCSIVMKLGDTQEVNNLQEKRSDSKDCGQFCSLEDLTPDLGTSVNESQGLVSKFKSSQMNEDEQMCELLAVCSGKFTGSTLDDRLQVLQSNETQGLQKSDEIVKAFSKTVTEDNERYDNDYISSNPMLRDEETSVNSTTQKFLDSDDDSENCFKPKERKIFRICLSEDEDEGSGHEEIEDKDIEDEDIAEDEETESEGIEGGGDGHSTVDRSQLHEEEKEFQGLNDFFENEAELSGSEIGSDDEMDDGADEWEEEDGDKEDLDEDEVREQVGRAHIKTLLDQDQREIRLFQELFLEDGDLHSDGDGRQRQFRWKNDSDDQVIETKATSFTQDDDDHVDDQNEIDLRKIRSEKDKWLQQQEFRKEDEHDLSIVLKRKVKTVKVTAHNSVSDSIDKEDSSAPTKNPISVARRGSFLRRSEKDLSAIASLTNKSVLPVQASRAGSNFVFASITPEKPIALEEKRKLKRDSSSRGESPNQSAVPAKRVKSCLSEKSIFSYF